MGLDIWNLHFTGPECYTNFTGVMKQNTDNGT